MLKVSDEVGYVIYSALGSFYIPSCIMVFVYIKIYYAARYINIPSSKVLMQGKLIAVAYNLRKY